MLILGPGPLEPSVGNNMIEIKTINVCDKTFLNVQYKEQVIWHECRGSK